MIGALMLTIALALRRGRLARTEGLVLLAAYPMFTVLALVS